MNCSSCSLQYAHFNRLEIRPEMYCLEWFMTTFARSLPLEVTHRIWDNFLIQGYAFLYRTALGLLKMFENRYLSMEFEGKWNKKHRTKQTSMHTI